MILFSDFLGIIFLSPPTIFISLYGVILIYRLFENEI